MPLALETTVKSSLTWNNRWLKLVACQLTPPHRINVWRLAVHPLVILVVPAIKMDAKETVDYTLHGGHADEPGLHQVHCFHLHACLEAMVWAVLGAEKMKKENPRPLHPVKTGVKAEVQCLLKCFPAP